MQLSYASDSDSKSQNTLADFLSFRRMITPMIIQIIFWVSVVILVLSALITIIGGILGGEAGAMVGGLLLLVVGPVLARVYCEILILFFRMNETLTNIQRNTAGRQDSKTV
jgi:hypothetical protein